MKWASLENKIQQDLSAYRPDVDADAIWAAIEPGVDAINSRKKRRGAFWLWWFGALAIATATVCFIYAHTEQSPSSNKGVASSINHIAAMETEPGLNESATPNDPGNEIGYNSANSEPSINSSIKRVNHDKDNLPMINKEEKIAIAADTKKNNNLIKIISPLAKQPETLPFNKEQATISPTQELSDARELTTSLDAFATKSIALFELDYPTPNNKGGEGFPALSAPPSLRRQFSLSASLQGSISFVGRELTAKAPTGSELRDLRERTEKMLESFQIGLGFTLGHRSGLGLSSGLNYTQINERFEYKATVIAVDTVYDIKYLVVTLNNDTIPIYGDVPLSTKTTFQKKYYNKLRMIDIPILAGYDIKLRNAAIGIQAGVFVNMQLKTEGQILQSASETIKLKEADIFKTNIGLSYYFGASAGYLFNDNIEAYIAPFVRHFPKSFTQSSYALQQRYNLFGVNMGVRYRF